jgi:large subunit ribosomal protein L24
VLARIKKDDTVRVVAGKDKGASGRVLRVLPERNRVVVERVNMVKRHMRATQSRPDGGILEIEAALDLSNVVPVCAKCGHGGRIRRQEVAGKKVRVCSKCGEPLDKV